MVSKQNAGPLVVEVDTPDNGSHWFRPLQQKVRGKFDPRRMDDPGPLARRFPKPIPGQLLGIDPDAGLGFIMEPLHQPEHAEVKAACEKIGSLAPERQEFQGVHAATWLYWLSKAVECGLATVVSGKVPEVIEGEPRKSFVSQPVADPMDRLAAAMERQNELLAKLVAGK